MPRIQAAAVLLAGVVGCQPSVAPAPATQPFKVTVEQVLTVQELVGETVRVSGRCLGKDDPTVSQGYGLSLKPSWQIEDQGHTAWVVGPMPAGCNDSPAVITARVAQDTLPKLSRPMWVRQYLVVR
jgi:hypothetical protein